MRPAWFRRIVHQSFLIIASGWLITGCASQQRPSAPLPPPTAPAVAPAPMPEESSKVPELKGDTSKIPVMKKADSYVHLVRWPGETLSAIAQWYTGSQKNVEVIVNANSGFDPRRMNIGDNILIPTDILKTREPMPQEYLSSPEPKKSSSTPSRAKLATETDKTKGKPAARLNKIELFELQDTDESAPESDKIELFGPVE